MGKVCISRLWEEDKYHGCRIILSIGLGISFSKENSLQIKDSFLSWLLAAQNVPNIQTEEICFTLYNTGYLYPAVTYIVK